MTPSFKQLDWLRLCVASVRDQMEEKAESGDGGPESGSRRHGADSERLAEGQPTGHPGSVGSCSGEQPRVAPEGEKPGDGANQLIHEREAKESNRQSENATPISHIPSSNSSTLRVEHIIQDAGSPGIEDFAREVGADFYRDGALIFAAQNQKPDTGKLKPEVGLRNAELPGNPESRIQNLESHYRIAIYCESDRGMYDAINRGLARSSGEICAWLNCDEQYLPGTLEKVAKIFSESPNLDVLLGDALLVDSKLQPVCYRRIMVPNRWHTRLDHLHSLSCAMFFKPSALPDPPLDPKWNVIGDAVLMDHFLGSRKRIHSCGELLSAYAFTGANLSANPAHDEHASWMNEVKWPPGFLRPLVVLHNRLRRMVHGAYGSFPVKAGLFTHESFASRTSTRASVPGKWPNPAV